MFPNSSSSSHSQASMAAGSLSRNGSAPGSVLNRAVDSVVANNNNGSSNYHDFSPFVSPPDFNLSQQQQHQHQQPEYHQYFSNDMSSISSESNCKVNNLNHHPDSDPKHSEPKRLQRSGSGMNDFNVDEFSIAANLKIGGGGAGGGSSSSSPALVRHSSSPAGFLNQLTGDLGGFSVPRGSGNYSRGTSSNGPGTSRLKPQLSFTRQDLNMSQLSGITENVIEGLNHNNGHRETHNYAYASDSWDNGTSITFSGPSSKRSKNEEEYLNCFSGLEHQFSLPQTTLEMATVEKLLQIPEDSVPCKIRAKRGFATHPRSIAERERRTRISGKLKKLQDLVPNMDKQTSYADMLDLAVQHIKGLQNQVQKLNKDMENCTCGCSRSNS
ncbi:hypothetical protein QQ045_028024 [Rhodiola kirilowii]